MGLFGDVNLNLGDVENPWDIPADTYLCMITNVETRMSSPKDENTTPKLGFILNYTIQEGSKEGMELSEWKWVPTSNFDGSDEKKALYSLQQRFMYLGIPQEHWNNPSEEDFIGITCYVTTKKREGSDRSQISKVVVAKNSNSGAVTSDWDV
jgi:hypothetical protein